MARDIDRKLRLTASLLGTVTRKDLAAAFRKANPNTSFDVGRADKWLQGRAQPRQIDIYDDWAKVLDIKQPGRWIADCDLESFLREICLRHRRDPADVQRRAEESSSPIARQAPGLDLRGNYVCYSHAWSPYFRGQLVRGAFTVTGSGGPNRLTATYSEALPTGPMDLEGSISLGHHDLRVDVSDPTGRTQLVSFCLFPPKPPASVLGGLMFGTTLIGPDAQPSVSRVAMVRLPGPSRSLRAASAYMASGNSISKDLAALGLVASEPGEIDRCIEAFLQASNTNGFDQVPIESYRALVNVLDRTWLGVEASKVARLRNG